MSAPQAATRLGVSRWTIYRFLHDGRLRRVWITHRLWGVTVRSVEQYELSLMQRNRDEADYPVIKSPREESLGL